MKKLVYKTKEEVSNYIAKEIIKQIQENPSSVLGLPTGSTPKDVYHILIEDYKANKTDYSKVVTFNLDEYVGVDEREPNSYRTYMKETLFDEVNIPYENRYFPLLSSVNQYDELIKAKGGIDLQLLGIGINGHIAFNEPESSFDSTTRIVELDESTRKRNAKYFIDEHNVPRQAISMGVASIMKAKRIILAATGEAKRNIIKRFLEEEISEDLPASILKTHCDVTLVLDEQSVRDSNKIE